MLVPRCLRPKTCNSPAIIKHQKGRAKETVHPSSAFSRLFSMSKPIAVIMERIIMRRFFLIMLGLSLLALLPCFATDASAQTRVPRINFKERTLSNGMRVISAEDHSSPTVAINVWYHVGSKDDPEGRSGFAHLFEHIMFKSTRNMKSEMMDRLTEDVGGQNNAFTADDVTVYWEIIPSNYLETLLWAEADRLAGLNVNNENFLSERDVVKEEFRQSYMAPPYGKL